MQACARQEFPRIKAEHSVVKMRALPIGMSASAEGGPTSCVWKQWDGPLLT